MAKGKKIALSVSLILVMAVALVAIVVPMVVDLDRYRPQVVAQLRKQTGKPVHIGRLRLTILPQVGVRIDDFSMGNPAGFPAGDLLKVKKIVAVADAFALLHHHVVITKLKLQDLTLDMLEDTQGKWNFENPAAPVEPPSPPSTINGAPFTLGAISKVSVTRGQLSAANLLPSGERGPSLLEVHGAEIDLHDVSFSSITSSSLGMPAASQVKYLSLSRALAEGSIKADTLLMGPIGVTKMKSSLRILFPRQIFFFDGLKLECYGGGAEGNLTLNFGSANLAYDVDVKVRDVQAAEFLDAFPQTKGLLSGTLDGSANMSGLVLKSSDPLSGVTGAGEAKIRDGKMPSLQITGNVRSLARVAGVGPAEGDPSAFSSLSADFRIADARLSSDKIILDGNGVGITGSGSLTMAGEGSLDYQGEASLAANGNNPFAAILGGLAGAKFSNGRMTFPFAVGGTLSRPRFSLTGGAGGETAAAPGAAAKPGNLMRGLSGFLKKKKQP